MDLLIISNDSYFITGLSHILNKFNACANNHIIFDAGGGIIYVLSPSDITELNKLDALSAFLANRYTTLPKNSSINHYIGIINKLSRGEGRGKIINKLSVIEIETLRMIAYKFMNLPTTDSSQCSMKKRSLYKRNGLEKLGLKNDNIFCSLVASWHNSYSQLKVADRNSV